MSRPSNVVMKIDEKLNFIDASNVVLGTTSGYSSKTETLTQPTGSTRDFDTKDYTITTTSLMDSDVKARVELTFDLKKAGADVDPADLRNNIGLADFPLNRAISTCDVKFTDYTETTAVSDELWMYSVSLPDQIATDISPAFFPDYSTKFEEGALDNPLRTIEDSSKPYSSARGLGTNYDIKISKKTPAGGNAYFEITLSWDEKIMARPYQFMEKNPHPFRNLGTHSVSLSFNHDALKAMVKCAAPDYSIDTPPNSNNYFDCRILTTTFTPHLKVKIPEILYYNAPKINRSSYKFPSLTKGEPYTSYQTMQIVSRKGVPSMMALVVVDPKSVNNPARPFSTLSIDSVSLKIGNYDSIFQNLTQRQLYEISRRNGYKLGFNSFSGQARNPVLKANDEANYDSGYSTNSWFFFTPSDCGLDEDMVANSGVEFDITPSIKATNNIGVAVDDPRAYLFMVNDNVVYQNGGSWDSFLPQLTSAQIAGASTEYENSDKSEYALGGKGKFWRGLKRFGKKVGHFLTSKPVKSAVRAVRNAPGVSELIPHRAHQVADKLGYGVNRLAGGVSKKKGGRVSRVGGKSLSKAQLRKMAGM